MTGLWDFGKNLLMKSKNEEKGLNDFSRRLTIADLIDREGKFMRIYYNEDKKEYFCKSIGNESWTEEALLKLKKEGYRVYASLEDISFLKRRRACF